MKPSSKHPKPPRKTNKIDRMQTRIHNLGVEIPSFPHLCSGQRGGRTPDRLDCRTSAGQVQDNYRTTTGQLRHPHWQAGHLQTCNMIIQSVGSVQFCVEKGHLLKTRMSNFYFVTLGMLAHAVLVWCGVRATGLTTGQPTTGQDRHQDKYRTSTGQLQDNYRTTTGHCPTVKPALRTRLRTLSCPPSGSGGPLFVPRSSRSHDHWARGKERKV